VIHRQSYVLSNNRRTKFADWVAYVIRPASFGPSRHRVWRSDPDIPASETLEPDDYWGAHAGLGTDRGHLVPLAGCAGASEWWATNYLSNITPRKSALNRGPWAQLEQAIRKLATSPSGFWKLAAIGPSDKMEAIAFIMDQALRRDVDYCAAGQRVDLPSLERRTGLRLFPDLDERAFARVVKSAPSMRARLGCDG
jgi:endonuclease G